MAGSIAMVTFAFNERELLESFIVKSHETLSNFFNDFEIVLVDDGSTDGSKEIIASLSKRFDRLKVITHPVNKGVGEAAYTGIMNASKDYIFWNDVDGHFDLADLDKIIPLLGPDKVVVGYKHNTIRTKNRFRWLMSRTNYYLIKTLFLSRIKDFQFVQFFPRRFLQEGVVIESRTSFIPAELLIKAGACGLKLEQIEICYHSYFSKFRLGKCADPRFIVKSITDILRFWFRWNFGARSNCARRYRQALP